MEAAELDHTTSILEVCVWRGVGGVFAWVISVFTKSAFNLRMISGLTVVCMLNHSLLIMLLINLVTPSHLEMQEASF